MKEYTSNNTASYGEKGVLFAFHTADVQYSPAASLGVSSACYVSLNLLIAIDSNPSFYKQMVSLLLKCLHSIILCDIYVLIIMKVCLTSEGLRDIFLCELCYYLPRNTSC